MEQTDAYDAYVDDGDPVDLAMAWEAGEARRRRENALLTKPDHAEAVRDRLTKLTDAERAVLDEISVEDGLHRTLRHVIEDASNGIDDILDAPGDFNVFRWTPRRFAIQRGAFRTRLDNITNATPAPASAADDQ